MGVRGEVLVLTLGGLVLLGAAWNVVVFGLGLLFAGWGTV